MQTSPSLFVLIAFLVIGACRATAGGPGTSPVGSWRLVELAGTDLGALARAPELTLGADGVLSGFAGVNRFSGHADVQALGEGRLLAGPMIATRMAGPPEAMEAETRVLALLGVPLEWRRRGAELELLQDGAVKARFVALE